MVLLKILNVESEIDYVKLVLLLTFHDANPLSSKVNVNDLQFLSRLFDIFRCVPVTHECRTVEHMGGKFAEYATSTRRRHSPTCTYMIVTLHE